MPLHSSISSAAVVAGIVLFLLAGHQTLRHRDVLKLRQEDIEALPLNVVIEVLLAAALCMIGSLSLAGDFRPIHATANQDTQATINYMPGCISIGWSLGIAAIECMRGMLIYRRLDAISVRKKGVDMDVFRPDFMAFNHRGFALPLSVEPISDTRKNKHQ